MLIVEIYNLNVAPIILTLFVFVHMFVRISLVIRLLFTNCYGCTSSIMQSRDLDMLVTNLRRNSSLIHIFRPILWLSWTVEKVCLRQSNTARAKSKLVRPHTWFVYACSIVCDPITLHLIVISVPNNMIHVS